MNRPSPEKFVRSPGAGPGNWGQSRVSFPLPLHPMEQDPKYWAKVRCEVRESNPGFSPLEIHRRTLELFGGLK